ncbi:polysaccharide biosynthesis tyrosine autokinase [Myceligenerans pegani]|uniref:non-specific protein-tyrosine kinase n=1 Tax=Myceligenerans pegani TaxID=2776917 RepID=A0ABR9MTV1_9MICO|nr:polysaccharide biosynthesis tyrosine autokinase [Myceligenerans sp. TRM 65318]MBE1874785.1 polysaccharide biosynthesis tyrosine autokinase [Myceligenerans sp. TRM 65318]MBE3017056.1 polysaccharide biosynthesis tyrosine autokinase [Myceligenerans sp. TRM 65318]
MELADYVAALRKRWVVLLVTLLAGGLAGLGYAQTVAPQYRATTSIFVSLERSDTVSELMQGANYTQNLVTSYASLATMPAVLNPVIAELGLTTTPRELSERIEAVVPLETAIIEISAEADGPWQAAEIANSVARHLSETVSEVSPSNADGRSAVRLTVVATAEAPEYPFAPNTRLLTAGGAAAGLAVGVLVAVGLALFDTRIRTAKDLPAGEDLAVLGTVPQIRKGAPDPQVLAESYRRVRTNLQFLDVGAPVRSFVVTSSVPNEGKTTTAIGLAHALAERGSRVLLVDADLRRPSLADRLGLEGTAGLSTVLIGRADLEDVVQQVGPPRFTVLTAGDLPPNPGRLIEADAMEQVVRQARAAYDVVIFDVPPLLPVTDGALLARRTQGAVVVARARTVRRAQLTDALASLDAIGATCLGLIATGVSRKDHDFDTYGGYGDGKTGSFRSRWRRT